MVKMSDLPQSWTTSLMKFIDKFILKFMWKGTGCRIAKVNKNKIEGIILIQRLTEKL